MPGSSPIEELTAAVEEVRRVLSKLYTSNADPAGRQPLNEVEAILAEQLQAVRQLFQPTPLTAHDQRVQPQPSSDIWPRGQRLQPLQQHQSVLQSDYMGIAPALSSSTTAPLQKVQKKSHQMVPATTQAVTVPPISSTIVIPVQVNQPVNLPPKSKNKHRYLELSPAEIRKVAKRQFRCIGMQFMDDEDQFDTSTGVVTCIVKHKKSQALVFKYWNHQVHDTEPTNEADFEYINVDHAVSNCKWSKHRSVAKRIAAALVTARILDDEFRNRGPTRSITKRDKKRNKLARANAAREQRVPEPNMVTAPPILTLHQNYEALSENAMQKVSQQARQCI